MHDMGDYHSHRYHPAMGSGELTSCSDYNYTCIYNYMEGEGSRLDTVDVNFMFYADGQNIIVATDLVDESGKVLYGSPAEQPLLLLDQSQLVYIALSTLA